MKSCQATLVGGHHNVGYCFEISANPTDGISISLEDEEVALGIAAVNVRDLDLIVCYIS